MRRNPAHGGRPRRDDAAARCTIETLSCSTTTHCRRRRRLATRVMIQARNIVTLSTVDDYTWKVTLDPLPPCEGDPPPVDHEVMDDPRAPPDPSTKAGGWTLEV